MVEHLQQQLVVLVDELRTVADPEAASERDSATAEAARERSYAEQRVTVRNALKQQLTQTARQPGPVPHE